MNLLILNGSPRGTRSNSLCLTNAFVEGMERHGALDKEVVAVNKLDIRPCLGCFACWKSTPGVCCISDDMAQVHEKIIRADVIIWSFPLYFFSLPSQLKALVDRQLPLLLPYMVPRAGGKNDGGAHPLRHDLSRARQVVLSTCGFYTAEFNYEAVDKLFDRCYGEGNYTKVYSGQGEMFQLGEMHGRVKDYLAAVRDAGSEFMQGGITQPTQVKLSQLLLSREMYEESSNASWPKQ